MAHSGRGPEIVQFIVKELVFIVRAERVKEGKCYNHQMTSLRLNENAYFGESFLLPFPGFAAVPGFDEREIVCCLGNPGRLITLKKQVQQIAAPDESRRS